MHNIFWQRISYNKSAFLSVTLLLLYFVVSLGCYILAVDNSADVNTQIPEIALHPPFVSMTFISLQNKDTQTEIRLKKAFFGSNIHTELIPVVSWHEAKDSIILKKYTGKNQFTGEPLPTETITLSKSKELLNKEYKIIRKTFPFGTDAFGRCVYSRILVGSRISLTVGLSAVLISLTIGILIGLAGGYYGGKTDTVLMLFVNTIWSIPTLLLVFAIVLALGRGVHILYLAIGLTLWVDVARIVRGQVMSAKQNVYIDAARSLGYDNKRIMFRHILPNIIGPILVIAAGNFATAIILEAGLSYLGFGVQPPTPSWGNMLNENYGYALSGYYFLAVIPALTIVLLVLSINILGNSLRDYFDVKIDK